MGVSQSNQGKMMLHVNFNLVVNASKKRVCFDESQECSLTEANHISICGNVTVNGVPCRHHTFLYFVKEGWKRYSAISLSCSDWKKTPSAAARKAANAQIPGLLIEALKKHPGIDEMRELAEERYLAHKLDVLRNEYTEAAEAFEAAKNALELAELAIQSPTPAYKVLSQEEIERLESY